MAWSAEERTEIIGALADWQERDPDGVGAADIKILTESSPTAGPAAEHVQLGSMKTHDVLLH